MAFSLDPELAPILMAGAAALANVEMPNKGDPRALRAFVDPILIATFSALPLREAVDSTDYQIPTETGSLLLRHYRLPGSSTTQAVVYAHGGGMICGSVAIYDRLMREYVAMTGVDFFAVDYRLAPEHRTDGLTFDVFAAFRWLIEKAPEFGLDPSRLALMGDSGGGGVAAAVAIMARDAGVRVAKQILIYPMLDDRTVKSDPLIEPYARWTYGFNETAWDAVLGKIEATPEPTAAPARLECFSELAPAYIDVGDLDIFRDENIEYMRKLLAAGVPCEFHLHTGAPHLFEGVDWSSSLTKRAFENRANAIKTI